MATSSFWDGLGTGLLQTGVGVLAGKESEKAMLERLKAARGPLYDQEIGLASKSLGLAGGMDPKAMAAERFAAQQGLVAPSNEADEQALMRKLQAKGMLGVASHQAVPGTAATPGVAMNPHMAALYAAQAGAKNKAAYDSLGEGEKYLDQLLNRSSKLQAGADDRARAIYNITPPKQSTSSRLLQGAGSLLSNPDIIKSLGGMFSGLIGGKTAAAPAPAPSYKPPVNEPNMTGAYDFDLSSYFTDYDDYDFGGGAYDYSFDGWDF
jgi:hypothetical protein